MVSDDIVIVTRSLKPEGVPLEWKGRGDGVYEIRRLDRDLSPGTRVYLRANETGRPFFEPEAVLEITRLYGSLLPIPITFRAKYRTSQEA